MTTPFDALATLWREAGLDADALRRVRLSGSDPALRSSFAVGSAAQASLAAAALAATELGRLRNGVAQTVTVDMREAALESCAYFTIDGRQPELWDPIAGLYRCSNGGWVRLHTNFATHRDRVLELLGLPPGPQTPREAVAAALRERDALAFENAAVEAGAVASALRDFETWSRHPQHAGVDALPLVEIERIGEVDPLPWPALAADARPLEGIRIVEMTRILAGPLAGRTLAAYGADVLLVNAPHLPNIEALADTSRGKRSARADLRIDAERERLLDVIAQAHVFLHSYRPASLDRFGLGAEALAARRPGLVVASLSAWGSSGPWANRRGFDSIVQTATGFNVDEAEAAGSAEPKPLPMQILDMASGFLLAFGIQAALARQRREGGTWRVRVALARTGAWLRGLGRVEEGFAAPKATSTTASSRQANPASDASSHRATPPTSARRRRAMRARRCRPDHTI